jgi:hypothetical protein
MRQVGVRAAAVEHDCGQVELSHLGQDVIPDLTQLAALRA